MLRMVWRCWMLVIFFEVPNFVINTGTIFLTGTIFFITMLVYFLNYLFHLKNLADLGNYLGILSLFIRIITDCLYRINSIIAVVCCVIYLFVLTVKQLKSDITKRIVTRTIMKTVSLYYKVYHGSITI